MQPIRGLRFNMMLNDVCVCLERRNIFLIINQIILIRSRGLCSVKIPLIIIIDWLHCICSLSANYWPNVAL